MITVPVFRPSLFALTIAIFAGATSSCTCVTCGDDDVPSVSGGQPWQDSVATYRERILGLLANDNELFTITESEFVRHAMAADSSLVELERRPLLRQWANVGQPALHPLLFARSIRDIGSGEELVQFSLIQNAASTRQIAIDSLGVEPLSAVFGGEVVGAFDRTGTVYLQPVYRRDTRRLALLRFELKTNTTFTDFTSIRYTGLIDFPNVRQSERAVSTIKWLDGNFYMATKQGAYLISRAGVSERIITPSADTRDIFRYEGIYYATQSTTGPLYVSHDGLSWSASGILTDLRLVRVFGDQLLSHDFEGWAWRVSDEITAQTRPLIMNEGFPEDNDKYYGMVNLRGSFYMSIDKKIVRGRELKMLAQ